MTESKIYVIKASGEKEEFQPEKIYTSLLRIGVDKDTAKEIVYEVSKRVKNNISTRELYRYVFYLLREKRHPRAHRYVLREAIMRLGPEGYPFEQFFAKILSAYGYITYTNRIIKGKCITHEIDIIAEKNNKRFLIECKYHNEFGIKTDVKVVLYVYARFLDLRHHFNNVWIATNTKLTKEAIDYAKCMKIKVTAWRYPYRQGLEHMIEQKKLYPITIITDLDDSLREKMLRNKLVLLRDIIETDTKNLSKLLGINYRRAYQLKEKALEIFSKEKSF